LLPFPLSTIGANIFLTSSGLIKLGDFGCSVKLNNAQTMPGEVNSTMGTAGEGAT
jgi:mitogen-activated protein kinase kinase kinase 4